MIDIFIAGSQKSGTTSLKETLNATGFFNTHEIEEFTYFVNTDERRKNIEDVYSQYFDSNDVSKLTLAKNVSLMLEHNAILTLKKVNPDCKVIILLREPVARAYSSFWYCRRVGWERQSSFSQAMRYKFENYNNDIERRNCNYINQSCYNRHLDKVFSVFPRNQVLILPFEMMKSDEHEFYRNVSNFIFNNETKIEVKASRVSNGSARSRSVLVSSIIRSKIPFSNKIKSILPASIVRNVKSIKQLLIKLNETKFIPPKIEENDREEFMDLLDEDLYPYLRRIGFDLSYWKVRK